MAGIGRRMKSPAWSAAEVQRLRDVYAAATTARALNLQALASELGRDKTNVCRKARALGLTNQKRPKIDAADLKTRVAKFPDAESRNAATSQRVKALWATRAHPRGALGMKHSPETLKVISEKSRASWSSAGTAHRSDERAAQRSEQMYQRIASGRMRSGHSRAAGGKRPDLENRYFRSAWEANYARYLNWLISKNEIRSWSYESKTFEFVGVKRGTRFYTPDFEVVLLGGATQWHEVKGWMDAASKTRLARMARYYPSETIVLIDETWFRSVHRKGLNRLIPNWEFQSRGARGC